MVAGVYGTGALITLTNIVQYVFIAFAFFRIEIYDVISKGCPCLGLAGVQPCHG